MTLTRLRIQSNTAAPFYTVYISRDIPVQIPYPLSIGTLIQRGVNQFAALSFKTLLGQAKVLQQRDLALQHAAALVKRIEIEIQAVSNDIAEARQNPLLPLGVDLLAANSQRSSDTTLASALSQLSTVRTRIIDYDRALKELDGR